MKVVREVRLHLGRTLGVVLAIAVGMVGAGSVMNTYSILKQALGEGYLATNPPSATLRTDPIDEDLLSRVEDLAGVTDVEAKRWVDGRVSVRRSVAAASSLHDERLPRQSHRAHRAGNRRVAADGRPDRHRAILTPVRQGATRR
jgi:hypothetical protein